MIRCAFTHTHPARALRVARAPPHRPTPTVGAVGASLRRIMSQPQIRQYATAVARSAAMGAPKLPTESFVQWDTVKSLQDLKFKYPDAELSDSALEIKVITRLKQVDVLERCVCVGPGFVRRHRGLLMGGTKMSCEPAVNQSRVRALRSQLCRRRAQGRNQPS